MKRYYPLFTSSRAQRGISSKRQEIPRCARDDVFPAWNDGLQLFIFCCLFFSCLTLQANPYYGTALCAYPQYECVKVGSGGSWERLFPNEEQRDLVQRLNRSYNAIWAGREIVVPRNLEHITLLDISPFPLQIDDLDKQVIVDQDKLAWGAYQDGKLIKWGPIASGRDKCPDSANSCKTMSGVFHFFSKENEHCRSNVYPIGKGGAPMPYCMYFHKGLALHGSNDIPGYRASHGCVRLFTSDAKWLNHEFVTITNDATNQPGTKVTVRPAILREDRS
ncbi:MAG: L,D-transpeptidase [Gammaproteobacteria bacterium]|nr:L,D-transpeptidase [Gammaproteobacteria bacterium]